MTTPTSNSAIKPTPGDAGVELTITVRAYDNGKVKVLLTSPADLSHPTLAGLYEDGEPWLDALANVTKLLRYLQDESAARNGRGRWGASMTIQQISGTPEEILAWMAGHPDAYFLSPATPRGNRGRYLHRTPCPHYGRGWNSPVMTTKLTGTRADLEQFDPGAATCHDCL